MARINFEDDVESHEEFWALVKTVQGNRDQALGMLVRFFRLAQRCFGCGVAITREELDRTGLGVMVDCGWALPWKDGFQVSQPEKHFGWYAQKCKAAPAGGRARSAAPRDARGRLQPGSSRPPAGIQPATSRSQPASSLPSPSPSPSQRNTNTGGGGLSKEGIRSCLEAWGETLASFEIQKDPKLDDAAITRLLQAHRLPDGAPDVEQTRLALIGARFEAKTTTFSPADHVSIRRVGENFEKFVNLALRRLPKDRETAEVVIPC